MEYVLTLNNIYAADEKEVGQRAVDLAELGRKRYDIPLTFVLNAQALEDFVEHNRLKQKGAECLAEGDYESLVRETFNGDFPSRMRAELREAYESLSVGGGDASGLVDSKDEPAVIVYPSTDYPLGDEYGHVLKNVTGLAEVMNAIKQVWASLMSEDAFARRKDIGIKEFFAGVVVMTMPKSEAYIRASSTKHSDSITVNSGFGYPDFKGELGTDHFEVGKDPIRIITHNVRHQSKRWWKDENGKMELLPLEGRGDEQKVNDKVIIEAARLTKKMANELEDGMRAFYSVKNEDEIKLLLADRMELPDISPEDDTTPTAKAGTNYRPEEVRDYYEDKEPDTEAAEDTDQEEYPADEDVEPEPDSDEAHDVDEYDGIFMEDDEGELEDEIKAFGEEPEIPEKDEEEPEELPDISWDSEPEQSDMTGVGEASTQPEKDDERPTGGEAASEGTKKDTQDDYEEIPLFDRSEADELQKEIEDDIEDIKGEFDDLVAEFKYDEETGESKEVREDEDEKVALKDLMDKIHKGIEDSEKLTREVSEDYETEKESWEEDGDPDDAEEESDFDNDYEPVETPEEKLEHVQNMQELLEELDGLVKEGHHEAVHEKLNRFEREVRELRRKHRK